MKNHDQASPTSEDLQETVISMAVESWRFRGVFCRLLTKLDAGEKRKYISQLGWFVKKIEVALQRFDLRIADIEGNPFDPGLAATALNIEEFNTEENLVVDQMIEPIILGKEGVVMRSGTMTLKKAEL